MLLFAEPPKADDAVLGDAPRKLPLDAWNNGFDGGVNTLFDEGAATGEAPKPLPNPAAGAAPPLDPPNNDVLGATAAGAAENGVGSAAAFPKRLFAG